MAKRMWVKSGALIWIGALLMGCATVRDAEVLSPLGYTSAKETQKLDERVSMLLLQLNAVQTEKDSLKTEFAAFREKTQNDISTLKKEHDSSQKEAKAEIAALRGEKDALKSALSTEMKNGQSDINLRLQALQSQTNRIQTEKDSLKNDFNAFHTDARKSQSDLSLRLQALQSQLGRVQAEKDSLRNDFTAFQKDTQNDLAVLKDGDKRLTAALSTETQRTRADLLSRLEALTSDIRTVSTGVEEYKGFLKKPLLEIDRVRENTALQVKTLEERGKTLEARDKAQEDRTRALEDRGKSQEDRTRVLEEKDKSREDRTRGLEERIRFYEDRARVLEERARWMEERYKDVDAKVSSLASKQGELEKTVIMSVPSITPQELYNEAYETFKRGELEKACNQFEVFLRGYPSMDLSDNAQFWIGEAYYQKKDYEKAVLEYEKVIARYPRGDTVPAALYKQALAFSELGDTANAKGLLKKLIEQYPNYDQIAAAKKTLDSMQ